MLGLGLGLGLGRKLLNGVSVLFNPLSLNPYLYFDARDSMLGELESPTLDLDPATPSTLDVITATRSGVATYTDSDGLIQTADPNTVRVDYTQGEELTPTKYQRVGYTDFSNTSYPLGWQSSGTTLVEGAGYLGQPSRIFTAELPYQYVACGFPTTAGVTYTGSIWVRRISGNETLVVQHSTSATGINSIPLSVTTEWTKVEVQFLGNASNGNVFFGIKVASPNAAGTSFEIAMPQVEEGTTASDFVPNTTGSPKFIASATYGPRVPMMLIEPSATNLFRNSQDLTASPNNIAKATITEESETFKGQPVFRITDDTSSGEHRLSIFPDSVTASRVIVHFFVKADTCTKFCITYPTTGDAAAAWDLQSGSALGSLFGSAVAQTIEDAGDGWFKVSMTYDRPTAIATGHNIHTLQDSATSAANRNYQGDGTLSFFMTMPQLEYGETQTSFIPTSGSTVTRAADNLVIDGTDFSDFYNPTEGTVYGEFSSKSAEDTALAEFRYLNSQNRIVAGYIAPNTPWVGLLNAFNGSVDCVLTAHSAPLDGTIMRGGFSYKQNNYKSSINGASDLSDTSVSVPTNINEVRIGKQSSINLNGHLKRLIYWPTHSDSL